MKLIKKLVGDISLEQMRFVDWAVTDTLGVFMPVSGQCYYAISPQHTHPSYLFTITFDSYCKIRIGETVYESIPSTITLIPPDVPHQELPSETVSRYLAVMIDRTFFEHQLSLYDVKISTKHCGTPFPVTERLVTAVKEFMVEYEEKFSGYKRMLAASAQIITHQIIRIMFGLSRENEKMATRMNVNRVIQYVNDHCGDKLGVSDLAHVACLSLSHFTRVFKMETGIAPGDYIMKVRLDKAKRLLRTGVNTVTEVGIRCGFNSTSYFSQCFSQAYKVSPSQFKKSVHTI